MIAFYILSWLVKTEKDMVELQREIASCQIESVRKAKEYLLCIKPDSLKGYHDRNKTNLRKGVELRRKVCMQQGLVNSTDENLITTLYAPLPFFTNSDISSDENEDLTSNKRKHPDEHDDNNNNKTKKRGFWDIFKFNH